MIRCAVLFPGLAEEPLKGDWPVDDEVFASWGPGPLYAIDDPAPPPDGASAGGDCCPP